MPSFIPKEDEYAYARKQAWNAFFNGGQVIGQFVLFWLTLLPKSMAAAVRFMMENGKADDED